MNGSGDSSQSGSSRRDISREDTRRAVPAVPLREGSGTDSLNPEVHRDSLRRLSWLAFIYSLTYIAVEGFGFFTHEHAEGVHSWTEHLPNLVPIAIGFLVAWAARAGKISPRMFPKVLVVFQLVSTFGIILSMWGWETRVRRRHERVARIGGADPDLFLGRLRDRGDRAHQHGRCELDRGVAPDRAPGASSLSSPDGLRILDERRDPAVLRLALGLRARGSARGRVDGHGASCSSCPCRSSSARESPSWVPGWCTGSRASSPTRARWEATASRKSSDEGGMGEVWRARHQLLARPAAIKLIRAEAVGGTDLSLARTALARFEREAQATSMLRLSAHDRDLRFRRDRGRELLLRHGAARRDGLPPLVERHGPIPANRAVYLLGQVCHSLADAHATGLIHRDIKPANLFTCRRGREDDFVKVLDFGLVKETARPVDVHLTAEGTTTGTPAFMAPEAVYGSDRVDARSDLYALGCIAYWLVTGKLVFEGDTPIRTLLGHLNEAPARPSTRTTQPLPPRFEQVIMECLEKDPAKRPPSAEVLHQRLDESLEGMPRWTVRDAREWWARIREKTARSQPDAPTAPPAEVIPT